MFLFCGMLRLDLKGRLMDFQHIASSLSHSLEPIFGDFDEVLIGRLFLSLILCGIIGLERSNHERSSGFRPHILVGLGACLMAMAGAYALPEFSNTRDPMRLASYVVSGIGFLGAGAILRHGTTVRGLTTAASIWCAAGIGITTGVGMGGLATTATFLILFTLVFLERLEKRMDRKHENDLNIYLNNDSKAVGKTLVALNRLGVPIKKVTMLPGPGMSAVLRIELNHSLKAQQIPLLVNRLMTLKHIEQVDTDSLNFDDEAVFQKLKTIEAPLEPDDDMDIKLRDDMLLHDLNEK